MADRMVLTAGAERKSYVKRMFNAIAHRYDFLNHLLSFGLDIRWRKKAISHLDQKRDYGFVLDLACGTGDFARETAQKTGARVIGTDIALQMLTTGSKKKGMQSVDLLNGDAEMLPFRDHRFDAVTIAFGIRNMGHVDTALSEMHRILTTGGQAIVLEFSTPEMQPFRTLYLFYFNHILPRVGRLISGDKQAYAYLPASVDAFPGIAEFMKKMETAGFRDVEAVPLLFGVAMIYKGCKAEDRSI